MKDLHQGLVGLAKPWFVPRTSLRDPNQMGNEFKEKLLAEATLALGWFGVLFFFPRYRFNFSHWL